MRIVLALHGGKDVTIPPAGGESYDHYFYASEAQTLDAFATANRCESHTVAWATPWSGVLPRHQCTQHRGCEHGASVAYCLFPTEAHGFWPKYAENLTWWWMSTQA